MTEGDSLGNKYIFGGKIVEFEKVDGINVFVKKSKSKTPKLTVYAGGRQPLTSQLAQTVQKVIGNKNHWLDFLTGPKRLIVFFLTQLSNFFNSASVKPK